MKKMRGFVDPISLGFIIVALGAGLVATATHSGDKSQEKTVKAQVEAPQNSNNRVSG